MFSEAESDPSLSQERFKAQEVRLRTALLQSQYALLQRADRSLLIVVAGIDGAGKGDTINLLNEWMDPRHIRTLAYGEPTPEAAQRPPLWRYWNELPPRGRIGIVFGSWYAPLLAEAGRKHPRERRIAEGIARARRFEAQLAANGVQLIKLWYHLSRDAQAARVERLSANPATAWQVAPVDRKVSRRFGRMRDAAQRVLSETDVPHAPWEVVPSADDTLRTVRTAEAVLRALRRRTAPRVARSHAPPPSGRLRIPDLLAGLDYDARVEKDAYEDQLAQLQSRLALAVRTPAFHQRSLVLVFEGQDAAGKGGAIRRVTHALDARQFDVLPIAAPAPHELARPYLWRFWRNVPAQGRIAIFDRSWYGRVLVERVEQLAKPAEWRRAYGEINDFEAQLSANGAIVVKFWLAVTPDVQLERFREREASPFKNFKITPDDWRNRKKWKAYADAANEMIARTSTATAPWHLVAANDKRHARLQVLHHVVEALEAHA